MITGITDSKKHYFIWNIVTIAIFSLLFFGVPLIMEAASLDADMSGSRESFGIGISDVLLYLLMCYVIATYPMGFFVRRKFMKKYIHVPTEQIKISESFRNPFVGSFRLIKCDILAAVDLILLVFYLVVSALVGIVIYPYQLISGLILLITAKM